MIWRFYAELVPFIIITVVTVVFWLIERRKFPVIQFKQPLKNILIGVIVGCIWIVVPVVVLKIIGVLSFNGTNVVSSLWLWAFSCMINVIMQELLVRGYIYQLLKYNYTKIHSIIVTTVLFTVLHGGAFEEGIIPVLCVITMSLFMSLVMEYTESLIAPILLHFAWNFIGAIIFNTIALASDYPHIFNANFNGNKIITGSNCLIEGSVIVLEFSL